MLICIADCNHGFFKPEQEESARLGVTLITPKCSQDNLAEQCQESDAIVVQRLQLTGEILDQIPTCKVVTRYGVGLDNIDCEAMKERGIKVINFPDFCTEEVANHTLAFILDAYRKLHELRKLYNQHVGPGWGNPFEVGEIQSANKTTIGVVGTGRIGKAVIKRLLVCGFNVIAYDPYVSDASITFVDDIETLFRESSIVTLHVSLNDETRHMVNSDLLRIMKQGSSLVNTSRGEVVSSKNILEALTRSINVFVDVWDPEVLESHDLLVSHGMEHSNHCAFYSKQSLEHLKRQAIIQTVEAYNAL